MRTNIVIDDKLMKKAQKILGLKTKKETVEEALKRVINLKAQAEIKKFRGEAKWEGNLQESRRAD